MKLALVLCAFLALATAKSVRVNLDEEWSNFKQKYAKSYRHDAEETLRRSIWENNVDFVEKHNMAAVDGMHTYTVAINEFADLTTQEFKALYNGFNISLSQGFEHDIFDPSEMTEELPETVDWRKKGYVTGVKDQKQCGSCWAFSAIGSLEGQHFKKTGKLVSLSEQNVVDCDTVDLGCMGGLMENAFNFIKKEEGVDTEASYPYTGRQGKCLFKKEDVGATLTGFVKVKKGSEEDLMKAVATVGPISVAIDAGHQSFQLYKKGVYYEPECSSTQLDHGVVAVGYGKEDGKDYWLVKNSWGTSWGTEGYIQMTRNKENNCGIATDASYPKV